MMNDAIHYENSAEFHREYAEFLEVAKELSVDEQAVATLAEHVRKCADAAQMNAFKMALSSPALAWDALHRDTTDDDAPADVVNLEVNDNPSVTDMSTLVEDKRLSLLCSVIDLDEEDLSDGIELTFLDDNDKEPDILLRITPALIHGRPIIKVEAHCFNQQ